MAVTWEPAEALARIRAGAMKGVVAATELVLERATVKIMSGPKTGRIYRRRGVVHQASAPGEAPANDLSSLALSGAAFYSTEAPTDPVIAVNAAGEANLAPDVLVGRVNWSSDHAAPLEFGTEKMDPRPFARNTLEESREEITGLIEAGVASELGR